jgi:hypothetical protein
MARKMKLVYGFALLDAGVLSTIHRLKHSQTEEKSK